MAKPISETPVLKGNDTKRFLAARERPRDPDAVRRERERVLSTYNRIKNTSPVRSPTGTK